MSHSKRRRLGITGPVGPPEKQLPKIGGPILLRAGSAHELLDIIPYLLGFHPQESLVVVLLCGGRVLLTARSDLVEDTAGLLTQIRRVAVGHGADAMFCVAYAAAPMPAQGMLLRLISKDSLPMVLDALHTDGVRWWSMMHPGDPAGELVQTGVLAAEAVYAGLTALPTRAHVVAVADPPVAKQVPALLEETERQLDLVGRLSFGRRVERVNQLINGFVGGQQPLSTAERVCLAVLVGQVAVRDRALRHLRPDKASALTACWSEVVGVAVPPWEVAPLCLLGLSAWVSGNGAVLVRCIERALAADPTSELAGLLAQVNDQALPPSEWERLAHRWQ